MFFGGCLKETQPAEDRQAKVMQSISPYAVFPTVVGSPNVFILCGVTKSNTSSIFFCVCVGGEEDNFFREEQIG